MHSTPCPSSCPGAREVSPESLDLCTADRCACLVCDDCGAHHPALVCTGETYGGAIWRSCPACLARIAGVREMAALVNRALLVGPAREMRRAS